MIKLKSHNYISTKEGINIHKRVYTNQIALHQHDFIKIVYVTGGSCTCYINQNKYVLKHGDVIFLNIGDVSGFSPHGSFSVINILVHPNFIDSHSYGISELVDGMTFFTSFYELENEVTRVPSHIRIPEKYLFEVETVMKSIIFEYNEKLIGYKTVLKGYLQVLITHLLRIVCLTDIKQPNVRSNLRVNFSAIIEHIDQNYRNKITLGELASKSFLNPSYFGQVFKSNLGMTPMEYVNHKRITEAARILREKDITAEQVCYIVGFKDKKHFYKLFKNYTGQTPCQFRKMKP